jgi:hypothetical protein
MLNNRILISKNLSSYQKFLSKAASGESITIAYLGGSISVGATTFPTKVINMYGNQYEFEYDIEKESWRGITYNWLKEKYEVREEQFKQINASIGGTDSILGAYRIKKQLLNVSPDFVFVEFAVNDCMEGIKSKENPYADSSIYRTNLSILSQLKESNPDVAIFIPVSTYRIDSLIKESKG